MALITSTNHITPTGPPSGAIIPPGASVDMPEWDDIKDHKGLAFYAVTGMLVVEGGMRSDDQDDEEAYRQQLLAELKALGVNADANSKTEALISKPAEVKAKATLPAGGAAQKQALIGQLTALGVLAGPDAFLEEFQKTLANEQAEQQ